MIIAFGQSGKKPAWFLMSSVVHNSCLQNGNVKLDQGLIYGNYVFLYIKISFINDCI